VVKEKRVPTGIPGLDSLAEGGFFKGNIVLLAGGTGSGKTVFSTQFTYNGATLYGEKGVYTTLEEGANSLRRNALRFGFNLEKLEHEGKVKVVDLEALKGDGLSANIESILNTVDEVKAERLVIDSLTALLTACSEKFDYRILTHLIYKMLKSRGCTTIMTCSIPLGSRTLGLGVEEFVADSLMTLQNTIEGTELKTRFLIQKMRGTNHSKKYHNIMITEKGIEIVPFTTT